MRKFILLALVFFTSFTAFTQDFSNKGKDFWVAYGYHQQMLFTNCPQGNPTLGGCQDMVLYFATDQVTTITLTIASIGWTRTYTSGAGNNIITSAAIPKTATMGGDVCLRTEGLSDKGIHITSNKPIVAYAHIYNQSVSGASILYPTNTLGREYYSVNFKNTSNSNNANCWFYVVATDTGTTTLKITPKANITGIVTTGNWVAGTTYTVTLTQGQVYNVMGILTNASNPFTAVDLTGSKVESVNTGSGCKKIGVFSGSGRISITCNANSSSSDNYMVQAMPKTAWGKKYLTVPANGNQAFNFYRVCVLNPATVVKINGVVTALPLQNNFYYEIPATNQPQIIEGDSAIMVAQYFTSQNACGNGNPGDPEVIYLSAVEQNINRVLWNATQFNAILTHHFNVVIPNTGTAISSFKLDGVTVPAASFVVHPQEPNYSYLKMQLTGGPFGDGRGFHIIQSDSGFNAIAYGFGAAESYGYNAGTNIKDLYQQIGVHTQYGIETTPSVCTNSPFQFKVSLPYCPDSITWDLSSLPGPPASVTMYYTTCIPGVGGPDSNTIVNGRSIHWYSLPSFYSFSVAGVYPVNIITYAPNGECGTLQEIPFDLTVSDPPVANFSWTPGGCVAEPYQFTETTPQFPKPTYKFYWNFGDPGSGGSNIDSVRNPIHTFSAPGTYNVKYIAITTPGCFTDTVTHQVVVAPLPSATIAGATTVCINAAQPNITFTGINGTPEYIFSYNIDNGGGPGPTLTATSAGGIAFVPVATNIAGTFRYNLLSVRNQNPAGTLCTQSYSNVFVDVVITPDATVTLTSAAGTDNQTVCINTAITNITYGVGGSGNGGSVSGLPAGVTGTFAAGVITITGTPSVSGTFIYTVSTTGPCVIPTTTGTITVTADATLTLTSVVGSDNQTLCINTPLLTNITYSVGGTGTGGSVSGLPAGVSGVYAGGVITISGTPTVSGVFNYTVSTTGPCVIPTATGTITVTADGTLTLTSAVGTDNQSLCINVPITNITYAVGGTGTGGSVSGLPPGVTGIFAGGVITITGSPTLIGTFIYTVSTTGPCVKPTATGTINVNPDASITLTSAPPTTSQELCRNSTIINITYAIAGGGTGAGVTGLPTGVTGVYAGGIFTISGSPTVAGLFNYTVTTTGTCVQNSLSGTILVNQLPTPNFSYTAPSCETRTISFTDLSVANSGNINRWTWDFGDGPPLVYIQNPTHTYTAAGIYNVTLTDTTDLGCTASLTRAVTINNRPQAGFIIPEVCLSDTYAQFIDTSTLANAAIDRWDWNFGDPGSGPLNVSSLQNPTHSYSAVGNYSVRLIVWNFALGCRDTITHILTVNGSFPIANFTVNNPATLCANDSVAIVEASTVFPGVITKIEIYWDNVNFPGVFQLDDFPFTGKIYRHLYPNFQTPLTKIFTIRYRAYSGGVCVNDKLANITVNAAPLVQFNAMPDVCYLAPPFQITQASEIGGVPGTGVFSGPGVSPTGLFTPTVAGIGTHTILYTFTSTAAGCVDTMSNTITVLDTAHAAFTHTSPICQTVPGSFTDVSTSPATVTLSNTVWNFGDGSPIENHAPGSTFGHLFLGPPRTFTVTMYNVSAYGCNSTVTSQPVTVDPDHTVSLNPGSDSNQTVCINTSIAPIIYTLGGGATGAVVTGLPAGVTYNVVGTTLTILGAPTTTLPSSIFNYKILTTGNSCIKDSTVGTITVKPDHTIALNPGSNINQSVCVNSAIIPITYTIGGGATGVTITGLPTGVGYSVTGTTLTISGTPVVTIPYLFNYAITTSGNSCIRANAAGSIRVNPYPVPNFAVDKPSYCIPNALVIFNNSSSMPDGSGMTYLWNFGEASSGSNTSTGYSPSHWYASEGPFNVRLTVTSSPPSGPGCVHDTVIVVNTIHPQPKTDFKPSKPSVCIKDQVIFTDLTDYKAGGSSFEWYWDMGDGTKKTINPVPYTFTDTITFSVTLYTVNNFGCNSDTLSKPFTVYPYPKVNAGPDRYILEGGQIVLAPVVYGNDLQFLWTPNQYLVDNRIEKVRISKPLTDMTYTLTVTARGGCQQSDIVFVKLLKFPVIPNTFTPNNDGINDTWRIDYLNTYPGNRVQVFTRTGQLIFESRGYGTPWDGTIKGKPLPFDTYYYIIEPGNGRDPITGYVTIIK